MRNIGMRLFIAGSKTRPSKCIATNSVHLFSIWSHSHIAVGVAKCFIASLVFPVCMQCCKRAFSTFFSRFFYFFISFTTMSLVQLWRWCKHIFALIGASFSLFVLLQSASLILPIPFSIHSLTAFNLYLVALQSELLCWFLSASSFCALPAFAF